MGVTLTQAPVAGFPDRPRGGGIGLRALAAAGDDGAYGSVELSAPQPLLHVRVMLKVEGLQGGRAVWMVGEADDGRAAFLWSFDAATDRFIVQAGSAVLDVERLPAPAWHALELRIDVAAGALALWRNGVQVGGAAGVTGLAAPRTVHVGLPIKHASTVGELHLDELAIDGSMIGPVCVQPDEADPADPARWLVVYNRGDADSRAWADDYRSKRGVPHANLCGLLLPSDEVIDGPTASSIVSAIESYVQVNGLQPQIVGVVLGHGVPGAYTRPDGSIEPLAATLQRPSAGTDDVANPLATADAATRPTVAALAGDWMTARIDAPAPAGSIALVDRAIAIEQVGLGDGVRAGIWLDADRGGGLDAPVEAELHAWADSPGRQALRLPIRVTEAAEPPADARFSAIDNDGFLWGLTGEAPDSGFFGEPAGVRVVAYAMVSDGATAASLRHVADPGWARAALDAGYAATIGTTRPITASAFGLIGRFFSRLAAGWTLGEAWHAASPLLRAGVVLIGDPLMRVAFPEAGWNVYGPFQGWADAQFDQPLAMLPAAERVLTVPPEAMPAPGGEAIYVVRRVDPAGREITTADAVRMTRP